MKPYLFLALAIVAIGIAAGPVLGQAGPPPAPAPLPPGPAVQPPAPAPAPPAEPGRGGWRDRRDDGDDEDIRELVTTILMVRMTRSLELTDEQTILMVRHMEELRDAMSKVGHERDTVMKELRDVVAKDGVTDAEIDAKLKQLVALDEKRSNLRHEAFEKAGANLSPKQQAKLYINLQDFEGQMRRLIQRAKEMGSDKMMRFREEMGKPDGDMRDANGPPFGGPDRPLLKQMMKNRKSGQPEDGATQPDEKRTPAEKP